MSTISRPTIQTFSIVACDLARGEWGVGVQSHYLAVGAIVPWARGGVGALATQAAGDPAHWTRAYPALAQGSHVTEVLARVIDADANPEGRQIGIVDSHGEAAAHTGKACESEAGHLVGDGYAIQGNTLAGGVLDAMEQAFLGARASDAPLVTGLLNALRAGEHAGGDRRGRQAAALLTSYREGAEHPGAAVNADGFDLRVDDHLDPLAQLSRLVLHQKVLWGLEPDFVSVESCAAQTAALLDSYGCPSRSGEWSTRALVDLLERFNFRCAWDSDHRLLDRRIFQVLSERLGGDAR